MKKRPFHFAAEAPAAVESAGGLGGVTLAVIFDSGLLRYPRTKPLSRRAEYSWASAGVRPGLAADLFSADGEARLSNIAARAGAKSGSSQRAKRLLALRASPVGAPRHTR